MEMEGMEGAILIFMLGNMEQTVARKQTKREKNNTQKRTEGWKQKGIWLFWYAVVPVLAFYLMECYEHNPFAEVRVGAQLFNIFLFELIIFSDRKNVFCVQSAVRTCCGVWNYQSLCDEIPFHTVCSVGSVFGWNSS